jgi:catechol 2,3-dioxygenase-like lactoylglutathione lyase family enzyme
MMRPNAMVYTNVFAGFPVADYAAAAAWYERLLGRAPTFHPNDHEAVWQLTETGWLYIIADGKRAGGGVNTVLVDDLDELVAGFAERGVGEVPIEVLPGLVRTAVVVDPDGNQLQFGQPP